MLTSRRYRLWRQRWCTKTRRTMVSTTAHKWAVPASHTSDICQLLLGASPHAMSSHATCHPLVHASGCHAETSAHVGELSMCKGGILPKITMSVKHGVKAPSAPLKSRLTYLHGINRPVEQE